MKEEKKTKYNWFQACSVLRISNLDRVVVEVKFGSKSLSEDEWRKLLKSEGIKICE